MKLDDVKITSTLIAGCLALATLAAPAHAGPIVFTTFVKGSDLISAVGGQTPIGFAYAGDRFVGSANYPSGNQLYQADLNGGSVTKFAAPLTGFSGEIFVASSFASGPYGANTIYAGAESGGSIVKIAHNGSSQSVFASGLVGGVRSIAFDPYGLYGNQMIVATSTGDIYEINSLGTGKTLLASVGQDTEGLSFAPQAFGSYAKGTLFVCSEGSGAVRAINPDGTFSTVFTVSGAETISFVPLSIGLSGNPVEGFYGVNYPLDIQKASASEFVPYAGDAIVTDEFGHGIYDVSASGAGFNINNIGYFPNQPEDSIFVTAETVKVHGAPDGASTALLLLGGLGLLGGLTRCRKPRTA
jgi:hypothetical protein